jgi:hypothetical protein
MENRPFDRLPMLQVLDDYSFEQCGSDFGIPDPFGIHNDDRPVAAHTEASGLTTLHSIRTEKEILSLQQLREQ